jgi:hypothetical protein
MAPIGRLLGTARIPQHGRDTLRFFPDTTHIVLMRANRFFRVDVLSQVFPRTIVKKLCGEASPCPLLSSVQRQIRRRSVVNKRTVRARRTAARCSRSRRSSGRSST